MVKAALAISEEFDTPVLLRVTTRICHSKSIVETGPREPAPKKPYQRDVLKYDLVPATARIRRVAVEARLGRLRKFTETTELNRVEWHDRRIGVIASGVGYQYAREVFGDGASYLKLGFTFPLPLQKIRSFAAAAVPGAAKATSRRGTSPAVNRAASRVASRAVRSQTR